MICESIQIAAIIIAFQTNHYINDAICDFNNDVDGGSYNKEKNNNNIIMMIISSMIIVFHRGG